MNNVALEDEKQRSKRGKHSSIYIGVSWSKCARKWQTQIKVNRTQHHLGYYANQKRAAHAFDDFLLAHNLSRGGNFVNVLQRLSSPHQARDHRSEDGGATETISSVRSSATSSGVVADGAGLRSPAASDAAISNVFDEHESTQYIAGFASTALSAAASALGAVEAGEQDVAANEANEEAVLPFYISCHHMTEYLYNLMLLFNDYYLQASIVLLLAVSVTAAGA